MWRRFSLKDLETHYPMSSSFQFGIVMAIVIGAFGLVTKNNWLFFVSAIVVVISFLRPSFLNYLNRIWYIFGLFLGWLISPLFLALFYYLIF
ncbi:MAG: hypothetical protein IT287_07420, partial [Bdellovibrionaceae bacterium]|nr:hypothetical protein [Pseudobdellovibrionaceae bacterium]